MRHCCVHRSFVYHLPTGWDVVKHDLLQTPVTCDWPSGGNGAWEQPGCGHLCVFLFHMTWSLWDMLFFSRQRKYCMVSWRIPFFVSLTHMKSILLNYSFHIGIRLSNFYGTLHLVMWPWMWTDIFRVFRWLSAWFSKQKVRIMPTSCLQITYSSNSIRAKIRSSELEISAVLALVLLLLDVYFGHCDWPAVLTESSSSGRFSPLLMPLFMEMKRSRVVLSFTQGLWRLVLSMMMANDRM